MKTYSVFLGLGSNLGEREKFLNRAVAELKSDDGVKIVWASSVYESEPFDKTDQPKFLNAAIEIETQFSPVELVEVIKRVELNLGRTSNERWGPREIDIDILLYDGLVYEDDSLHVPHAGLAERKFVLIPLKEIAPDLVHPVNGMTITELAQACKDTGRVVKSSFHLRV